MFSEEVHKKHLEYLNQLRLATDALQFESRLIKKGEHIPIHLLLVAITVDYKERDRFINFSYIPLEDEFEYIQLLQFYATMPFESEMSNREQVEKLLHVINSQMAVGNFGIQEDEIFARYIYTQHRDSGINEEQFSETVLLFIAMLDMYEKIIESVYNGEMNLERALQLLGEA